MQVQVQELSNVAVLDVVGEMPVFDTAFRDRFNGLFIAGRRNFVVLLRSVTLISDFGIGSIIHAYAMVRKAGGRLVLADPSKPVQDLLTAARLSHVFEVFDKLEDALFTFGPGANR